MAGFSDILGTVAGYFRIGKDGIRLKNNAGALDVRNTGDSAYANLAANRVSLVDPANPSRAVGLDSPTLAAGYNMAFPNAIGAAGMTMRRTGATGTEWAYTKTMQNSIRVQVNANGSPGSSGTVLLVSDGGIESLYSHAKQDWIDTPVSATTSVNVAAGVTPVPFLPVDIFVYHDDSTHTMSSYLAQWQNSGVTKSITNITNASPPVWTVGASHGFTVGMVVCVQGITSGATGFNNRLYRVSAVASTTVTLIDIDGTALTAGGSGSSGTMYQVQPQSTRATGFSVGNSQDGIWGGNLGNTLIGSGQYLWAKLVATVCFGVTANTIDDTAEYPFISNVYNSRTAPVGSIPSGTTADWWTPQTTADTPANARAINAYWGKGRQWVLSCLPNRNALSLEHQLNAYPPAAASQATAYINYMALDSVTNYDHSNPQNYSWPSSNTHIAGATAANLERYIQQVVCTYRANAGEGLHYFQMMEFIHNSGANTWAIWRNFAGGTNNQYFLKGGFRGTVER